MSLVRHLMDLGQPDVTELRQHVETLCTARKTMLDQLHRFRGDLAKFRAGVSDSTIKTKSIEVELRAIQLRLLVCSADKSK